MRSGGRSAVVSSCPDCLIDTGHCHGGVLIHRSGEAECVLGTGCALPLEAHPFVDDCTAVEPACGCRDGGNGSQ